MKTLRCIFLTVLIPLIIPFKANATDDYIPKIIPPSPESASLGQYGEIPVSLYTGLPNISIPLYQIKIRDITVPISISYHASGIKVNQESSSVGLGWVLNAGGVVTRTVLNKDDFDTDSHYFDAAIPELFFEPSLNQINEYFQSGCKVGVFDIANNEMDTINLGPYIDREHNYEFEPDLYNYNFSGHSGKLLFKRNKEAVLADKEHIKIYFNDPNYNLIIIETPDGFKYTFDEIETYTSYDDPVPVKTAWYLTKIKSPLGEEVTLHYSSDNTFTKPQGSIYIQRTLYTYGTGTCPARNVDKVTENRKYKNVYLDYIDWRNGKLVFDYVSDRIDLDGGKRLNKIELFEKDSQGNVGTSPFKQFIFQQDYFTGMGDDDIYGTSGSTNYLSKRMRLDALKEISNGIEKKYRFEYYEQTNMLSKNSYARDHWGYPNQYGSNTSLIPGLKGTLKYPTAHYTEITGANRTPAAVYANVYSLRKIIYPTGGYTELVYEQHDYDVEQSNIRDASEEAQLYPDLGETSVTFTDEQSGQYIYDTLDLTDAYVTIDGHVELELSAVFRSSGNCDQVSVNSGQIYFTLSTLSGQQVSWVDFVDRSCDTIPYPVCTYSNTYSLNDEKYVWKAYIDGNVSGFEEIRATYTFDYLKAGSNNPISNAGGIRIKEIINSDGINNDNDVIKRYEYHYMADKNNDGIVEEHSYGRLMSKPQYYWWEFDVFSYETGEGTQWGTCHRLMASSESTVTPQFSASGGMVGYDTVVVLYGKRGTEYGKYGKSIYVYENVPDAVYNYGAERAKGLSNMPWPKNGQELWSADYVNENGQYRKVSERINQYAHIHETHEEIYYAIKAIPINYSDPGYAYDDCDVKLYIYPLIVSCWNKLEHTTQISYGSSNAAGALTTSQQVLYDNDVHKLPTRTITTNSDGTKTTEYTLYPDDYTDSTGFIGQMKDHFNVNKPLEKVSVIESGPSSRKIKDAKIYRYSLDSGSVLKTVSVYESDNPVLNNYKFSNQSMAGQLPFENPAQSFSEGNDLTERIKLYYGVEHEMIEMRLDGGSVTSYIWGYNNSLPVAKIEGASYDQVKQALGGSITLTNGALSTTQENTLRDMPNTMVTTFTYEPLKGMKSSTDPAGNTTFFDYDDFGRLEAVKDDDANIVKAYEYNYATPPELTVTPTALDYTSAGGNQNMNITANLNWSLSISYDQPRNKGWISTSSASGTGDANITVTIAQSTFSSLRSGKITVSETSGYGLPDRVVTISQQGVSPYLNVSKTSMSFTSTSTTDYFDVSSNVAWDTNIFYYDGLDWIQGVYPSSGSGNVNGISVVVDNFPPYGETWEAEIEVYGGGISKIILVTVSYY